MLSTYGEKNQIPQSSQEGFRQERSTTRQIQTLIAALEDAKLTNQDIYILYIAFKNTFGSIDHARLLTIIEDLGYPLDAIEIIGNTYTNSTTKYIGEYFNKTEPIHIQRGTIQGDTLSQYLFILFLEPLLRWLQRGYIFKTFNSHESIGAYANDLATITNNIIAIQPQINKIKKFNSWAGMDLNIFKCAIMRASNKSKMTPKIFKSYIQSHKINYNRKQIPILHQTNHINT
jgi:hypothetical protein